jgi:hypothetical protein
MARILQAERAESFAPFFPDRVMRRLAGPDPAKDATLYDSLRWVFVRAAVACLILIVAVGLLNSLDYNGSEAASWIDALLGLPSDAITDVLTYDLI